jgi:hypothetical protein
MTETARERSRRLYGRPRVPRPDRRVMLALLAADDLAVYPLSRLAQVRPGRVHGVILARMRALGWVGWRPDEASGRVHALTRKGRACVTLLLGLPPGNGDGDA